MKPLVALLLLAGCWKGIDPLPTVPPECRSEVESDPAVHQAISDTPTTTQESHFRALEQESLAERAAIQRCLARRGLARPGGVEPVEVPGLR